MSAETDQTHIYQCERYPFYGITGGHHDVVADVPTEILERWRQVMAEFEKVQDEMKVAHSAATARHAEAARIKKAEYEVAAAQARLERIRHEQEYPPDDPASWPAPGVSTCGGWQYPDEKAALADRVRFHNAYPRMRFDVMPYRCVDGHVHLGRTS